MKCPANASRCAQQRGRRKTLIIKERENSKEINPPEQAA